MSGRALKLLAQDAQDLSVLSACLQDALLCVEDMAFVEAERRFVAVFSRFRWEAAVVKGIDGPRSQVRSGLRFEGVRAVRSRGIDREKRSELLELLTLALEENTGDDEKGVSIQLLFAGGGEIRLFADTLSCALEDLGESWTIHVSPKHDLI
ncbi:MAG: DUF2948 family protein [Proteobacteria bacterium]|nr:DUF2948 family protein [Pseudomonadota bacterium]